MVAKITELIQHKTVAGTLLKNQSADITWWFTNFNDRKSFNTFQFFPKKYKKLLILIYM